VAPLVRKSGCFGCLFSGSVGCFAFITGSLAAALLFAPNILGGSAARFIENALGRKWDGRLEIANVDLSWTGTQSVRGLQLFDPEGEEVMRGLVTLPGVLKWDSSEGQFLTSIDLEELNVHRDLDGVSGLARAVGRGQVPWPQAPLDWSVANFRGRDGLAQRRSYELAWHLALGQWRDDRRPDFLMRVHGARGKLVHTALGGTVLTATGQVSLGGLEGEFNVLCQRAADGAWTGHVQAEGLPSQVLEELAEGLADLPVWCGESVDLSVFLGEQALRGADQEPVLGEGTPVLVQLNSEHAQGRVLGLWSEGQLLAGDGGMATFEARLPGELCSQFGSRALPAALALDPGEELNWRWVARDYALPLWGAGATTPASYTVEGQVLGELTLADANGEPLARLAQGSFKLLKSSTSRPELHTSAILRPIQHTPEQPGARVEYKLRAESEVDWPWAGSEVSYAADGYGLTGSTLDAVLGLDGLLDELLGEGVEGHAAGDLRSSTSRPHRVSLGNTEGVLLEGLEFQDGRLHYARGETRQLELPLGPNLARVLVQPAVPLLATLEPISGRLRLEATDLELAWVDGGAYLVAGELVLDPGEVNVRLHPGLAGLFEAEPEPGPMPLVLLPVRVSAEGSLLRYSELTLPLAGEECDLVGTFDRDTGRLAFMTEASLLVAAHKLALPMGARSVLTDSAYILEMTISGTLGEPSLNFSAEVVGQFMNGGIQQLLRGTPISLLNGAVQSLIEND
jgi:hypothetical protein